MNTDEAPPDVPEGVLVQSILVDPEGRRSGYRIHADGRYEALSREAGWAEQAPLGEARLRAVRAALDAVALEDLAGRYEADTGESEPNVLWVQIARGGQVRNVSVVGGRRVPELERLTARLTEAFSP
jgi:hypothetical protein